MRKYRWTTLFAAAVLTLSLAACDNPKPPAPSDTDSSLSTEQGASTGQRPSPETKPAPETVPETESETTPGETETDPESETTPDETETDPESETDENNGHVHQFSRWRPSKPARCTTDGKQVRACSTCGDFEWRTIPATGHTMVTDPAVAPTCTTDGLTEGSHCTTCNYVEVHQETLYRFHSGNVTYEHNGTHHWAHCSVCDEDIKYAEHFMSPDGSHCLVCEPRATTVDYMHEVSSDGTYAIFRYYIGTEAHVQIPDTIDGLPVKEIGSFAFYQNPHIQSVVIPNSVFYIGERNFSECENLKKVVMGDSVVSLGLHAFSKCASLTNVLMSERLNEAGGTFYDCPSLVSIKIPENMTDLGGMFMNCGSLSEVIFHDGIKSVGLYAFKGCASLRTEYKNCFYVGTPENPYMILTDPTDYKLDHYEIHPDTKYIAGGAFIFCDKLTSIVIPDSVVSIGVSAFQDSYALTEITLGAGLERIGHRAFHSCISLKSVEIPAGVYDMGEEIFFNCNDLETVTIHSKVIGRSMFDCCSELKTIVFGDNVTTIEECAFYRCGSLTSVVIPDSVTDIGTAAFMHCDELSHIVFGRGTKSIGTNVIQETPITDIYYRGSEAEWEQIAISENNIVLGLATVHYDYIGE